MSGTALDPGMVVAALQEWHEDHARCLAAVDRALASPPIVLPDQVPVETYVAGGAVYDALIAESALDAGAGEILTSNLRDFERVAPVGLAVPAPPSP